MRSTRRSVCLPPLLAALLLAVLLFVAVPCRARSVMVRTPAPPQPRAAGELVGLLLQNPAGIRLPAGPVAFGQVFVPGQVPRGAALAARVDGQAAPVQLDVKATNPDGSVRMGVVTLAAPALAAGASVPAMLELAPAGAPAGTAVDLAAAHTGLAVSIALAGEAAAHVLDVDALLARALRDGTASVWLRGPLAAEARVDTPVAGSLHVVLDVRRYADGTHLTDVQFDNDLALQPVGGEADYDVTITKDGRTVFARPGLRQFQYTTWHREIADRLPPLVVHDVAYLERAGAILDYDLSGVPAAALAAEERLLGKDGPAFDVFGNAGLVRYMGTTGGRSDIGPTTEANAIWLATQDPTARAFALAQADAAGGIPWHFFEAAAGSHLSVQRHPTLWTDGRGGSHGTTGLTQPAHPYSRDCDCWSLDAAHQPDLSYVPYLLTGSRYRLDELVAQASWDVAGTWPGPRQNGRGIVVAPAFQVRGIAWNLRGIDNAAYALPDAHPLKGYFRQLRHDNYAALLEQAAQLTPRQGEAYGWLLAGLNGGAKTIAPWQEDYLGLVVAQAAKQGVPEARQFLRWESNFLVGRFLAADRGFSPYDGAAYQLAVLLNDAPGESLGSPSERLAATWADIERATRIAGFSGCPDADLANCTWAKGAYPQYRQQAYAVVTEIGRVLALPEAKKAAAWLAAHVDRKILGPAHGVRFSIAPLP
jgi:hypothetical protein